MFPRNLVLGIVCPKGIPAEQLEQVVGGVLASKHLSRERVSAIFSEDSLAKEPAMMKLADRLDAAYFTYTESQLDLAGKADTLPCQRYAALGSRNGKQLTQCCQKSGMQVCIYEKKIELRF